MAHKPEDERDAFGIARVGKRKWGYDVAQVDAFLERAHSLYEGEGAQLTSKDIQGASFDMRRGGYEYKQVDAALDRLERAVVDKKTAWEISQGGRVASRAKIEALFAQVAEHAQRSMGERFAPGKAKMPSYDRAQVDAAVDRIVAHVSSELHAMDTAYEEPQHHDTDDQGVSAASVSHEVFTQRKGKKGYDERQVDYYLSVCTHLLTRLESFARVSGYDESAVSSALARATGAGAPVASTESSLMPEQDSEFGQRTEILGSSPLIPDDAAERRMPPAYAPTESPQRATSFDELHKAEQEVFAPVASPTATAEPQDQPAHVASAASATEPAEPSGPAESADVLRNTMSAAAASAVVAGESGVSSASQSQAAIKTADGADEGTDDGTDHNGDHDGVHRGAADQRVPAARPRRVPREHEIMPIPDAMDDDSVEREDEGRSSLSALAHIAETSHDQPVVEATPANPHVPSLPSFSMSEFDGHAEQGTPAQSASHHETDESAATHDSRATGTATMTQGESGDRDTSAGTSTAPVSFPAMFSKSDDDFDLNIPDLSFPTFSDTHADASADAASDESKSNEDESHDGQPDADEASNR